MAAAANLDFENFKFLTVGMVRSFEMLNRASRISSKSVKPRSKYGDFSIFQDGGRRHLGFWKFQIFHGLGDLEGRTASSCQISSKSVKPRSKYDYF